MTGQLIATSVAKPSRSAVLTVHLWNPFHIHARSSSHSAQIGTSSSLDTRMHARIFAARYGESFPHHRPDRFKLRSVGEAESEPQ